MKEACKEACSSIESQTMEGAQAAAAERSGGSYIVKLYLNYI